MRVALLAAAAAAAGTSFITLGDWGGFALQEPSKPYHQNVIDVAAQMAKTATANDVKFIVNTGDNFYWCGIENTSDFQVQADWVGPYAAASLQVPWYSVLGNHEYGYNVSAQVELTKLHNYWVMDDRYFSRRVQLDGTHYATMLFLDTSPCVSEYRSARSAGWDPCGTEYPTCSMSGGSDPFEGQCHFNTNILSQDCQAQYKWFQQALAAVPKDDWLFVVGHHPGDEMDVADLTGLMQQHGFDMYLNGHVHVLAQYTLDGKGAYVTSGAGSLVVTADQLGGTPGTDRTKAKASNVGLEVLADAEQQPFGHAYKSEFYAKTSGFTLHTFSEDYATLTTQFLDAHGKVLRSFTVSKGKPPSPSPSPAPGPKPGTCCFHRSTDCHAGQSCCETSGKTYSSESTCEEYGKIHHCVWQDGTCRVGSGFLALSV